MQEKQEFIGLLSKDLNEAIHKVADKNNWANGSKEKTALHAIVSGMLSEMSGSGFSSGAFAGGVNEYVIGYLIRTKHEQWMLDHPDLVEWISTAVGGAMSKVPGGDVSTGAGAALEGTKWNYFGFEIPQDSLIQKTLKRKDGKPISKDEARDLGDEMQEIAYDIDPYDIDPSEKDHGNRLVIGSTEVIDAVKKALLNKGYTTDSVELYVSEYKNLVNEVNDSIPAYVRPVNVIANGEKAGEIVADAVHAGKEVVYPLKMAGAMFDINDVIQSPNPKDEIFTIGWGKFSAAVVGSVVIGVGTHTTLSPWIIYGISGVAEWSVEEKVKSYFEDQLKKFRVKQNSEKSDEDTRG